MLKSFDSMAEHVKASGHKARIVVAAAHDFHTLEGIAMAYVQGIATPILIGDEKQIKSIIKNKNLPLPFDEEGGAKIIDISDGKAAAAEAVSLVRKGQADILMKGILPTAQLLKEVVNRKTGIKGEGLLSHVGLFQIPAYHKLILLTDGGMIISPDVVEKRSIVQNAVEVMENMGCSIPKVAVLCATEEVNTKMQASIDAAKLKEWNEAGLITECLVEGPISFDLTFDKDAALIKGYESPVAGDADIWLMPDMTAGNLLAKSLMYAGGAMMAGVIVGASVPIVVVSRGATAAEKYYSLIFAAAAAGRGGVNGA